MRVAWLLLLATACQQASRTDAPAAASGAAAPRASAPAPASAPTKAWYEGEWQGVYQAELFRLEAPLGGVKEWKLDDGKQASGAGKLSLAAAADGSVTGRASGALGELEVNGRIDGERAALMLVSAEPSGFHGVILATRTPEGMRGTLNASSADSLQARRGSVTLARAAK